MAKEGHLLTNREIVEAFPAGIISSSYFSSPPKVPASSGRKLKPEKNYIRTHMHILTEKWIFELFAGGDPGFSWGKFFAEKNSSVIKSM